MDTKIIQIIPEQWTGREGNVNTEVLGLGDDSMIYRWHKGTGKFVLHVINK